MMIKRFGDGRDWFFKQRFGMFVHWGIYSVAGWQEQMQSGGMARSRAGRRHGIRLFHDKAP